MTPEPTKNLQHRTPLQQQADAVFEEQFGYPPSHHFHAPGRVNLIGEHTDYNDGFVLPAAINFGTVVSVAKRDDTKIRVCSVNFNKQAVVFDYNKPIESDLEFAWSNYVRGVCFHLLKAGYSLCGLDLTINGDVPYGAGLSSSAALEIVLIRTFLSMADQSIDPTKAALLGQETENEFIGAKTGIMDQLICARGEKDSALLIDCRSLETQAVSIDPEFRIVIFNSNVKRGLVDSEYNVRREQCQKAAEILSVSHLRDADIALLEQNKTLMDDVTYRRARHVITENARTLDAARALANKDWPTMSSLMAESHRSMSHDFEITVPAIDGLVDIIAELIQGEKGGVRMTGGGFGGCVVSLVHKDLVNSLVDHVAANYEAKFGIKESVYICTSVNGAFVAD